MNTLLSTLHIRIAVTANQRMGREWHGVNYRDAVSRLYFTESGEAWVRHHSRRYKLAPGRLHMIPAGTVMSYGCDSEFIQHWTHFNATLFGGMEIYDAVPCRYDVPIENVETTFQAIQRVHAKASSSRLSDQIEVHGLMLQLLAPFFNTTRDYKPQSPIIQSLSTTIQYIESNLGDRLPVSVLAKLAGMERTNFTKVFSQFTGMPPARYIQHRRIEIAREILRNEDITLAVIADRLGFVDEFHFSKVFKRLTAMPPSVFRSRANFP